MERATRNQSDIANPPVVFCLGAAARLLSESSISWAQLTLKMSYLGPDSTMETK